MKIQILGSGCANCKKLYELTKQAVAELETKDEVEYITDVSKIIEMGVMSSPVLAIEGKPALVGFIPDLKKIKDTIANHKTCCESGKCACKCGGKC